MGLGATQSIPPKNGSKSAVSRDIIISLSSGNFVSSSYSTAAISAFFLSLMTSKAKPLIRSLNSAFVIIYYV